MAANNMCPHTPQQADAKANTDASRSPSAVQMGQSILTQVQPKCNTGAKQAAWQCQCKCKCNAYVNTNTSANGSNHADTCKHAHTQCKCKCKYKCNRRNNLQMPVQVQTSVQCMIRPQACQNFSHYICAVHYGSTYNMVTINQLSSMCCRLQVLDCSGSSC